jgi:hypothetical protein
MIEVYIDRYMCNDHVPRHEDNTRGLDWRGEKLRHQSRTEPVNVTYETCMLNLILDEAEVLRSAACCQCITVIDHDIRSRTKRSALRMISAWKRSSGMSVRRPSFTCQSINKTLRPHDMAHRGCQFLSHMRFWTDLQCVRFYVNFSPLQSLS